MHHLIGAHLRKALSGNSSRANVRVYLNNDPVARQFRVSGASWYTRFTTAIV